jgi:hypothetical protein
LGTRQGSVAKNILATITGGEKLGMTSVSGMSGKFCNTSAKLA